MSKRGQHFAVKSKLKIEGDRDGKPKTSPYKTRNSGSKVQNFRKRSVSSSSSSSSYDDFRDAPLSKIVKKNVKTDLDKKHRENGKSAAEMNIPKAGTQRQINGNSTKKKLAKTEECERKTPKKRPVRELSTSSTEFEPDNKDQKSSKAKSKQANGDKKAPVTKKRTTAASSKSDHRKRRTSPIATRSSSASSESEWEDVAEHTVPSSSLLHDEAHCSKSIQITVNAPKTRKQLDAEAIVKREINRFRKEYQENLHKVHLLAYIAHGRLLSEACNDTLNQSIALSMVPLGYTDLGREKNVGVDQLKRFAKWLRSSFTLANEKDLFLENDSAVAGGDWVSAIRRGLQERNGLNFKMLALCLVTTIRSLGFDARIVLNAQPESRKVENDSDGSESASKSKKGKTEEKKDKNSSSDTKNSTEKKVKPKMKKMMVGNEEKLVPADYGEKKINACDYLVEVYLEKQERWIPIDCNTGKVDCIDEIREQLSPPVIYCLAVDKDLALKDVTCRYATNFASTQMRRSRVQVDWLRQTLQYFASRKLLRNRLEDMLMEKQLSEQGLPTSISDFKNHPLYVLKKDLLKFEAIYPSDTKPVGYIRKEPVYPRSAVHTLHSKDTWRKQALVVKEGEESYKIVKGRPKPGVPKHEQQERMVPVYGLWQTEPYKPLPAVNGVVPRNEYGNVELFQMSMLPPGTVYLPINGLLQVAKKLDIDCAPAMMGWDFHGGFSHPVLNGWVICEEHKDALLAAYEEEQRNAAERDREKKSKRAIQNWRTLIRGLLLREKVRRKFTNTVGASSAATSAKRASVEVEENGEKKMRKKEGKSKNEEVDQQEEEEFETKAWPQNRRDFTREEQL